MKITSFLSILFIGLIPFIGNSQFLPFQGKLFDANDQPINGIRNFVFSIKDGGVDWDETQSNIMVYQGIYAVVLGSQTPLPNDLFATSAMHTLNIQVNGESLADVMLYAPIENDPKVPDNLKDGVSWDEVSDKPSIDGVPIGTVVSFAGLSANIPDGWLECDGSALLRSEYPELLNMIGVSWGVGDGLTTFNIPDLRGVFLRGVNGTRSDAYADPGNRTDLLNIAKTGVGSYQGDQLENHQHRVQDRSLSFTGIFAGNGGSGGTAIIDNRTTTDPINPCAGEESRTKKAADYFIIKAKN